MVVAGGGVDGFKLPQAFVQIDRDIFVDAEGADAAGSMADLSFHFLEGNHFGFGMEGIFVFPVVDLCGSFSQNQHRLLFLEKGKGLGDHSGFHAEGFGGLRHRRRGSCQMDYAIQHSFLFEIFFRFY